MALNFVETGPADQLKTELDALTGLTAAEEIVRTNADAGLTEYGSQEVKATVQTLGWTVIPTE